MEQRSQCWPEKIKDFSAWDGSSGVENAPPPPQFPEQVAELQVLAESTVVLQLVCPSSKSPGTAETLPSISYSASTPWRIPITAKWVLVGIGDQK